MIRLASVNVAAVVGLALAVGCKFPYPADVPDDDGDGGAADGGTIDSHVRSGPIVANHQLADLVLGQPDFTTRARPPIGPTYLNEASGIGGHGRRLWVADQDPVHRVMAFEPLPSANGAAAAFAIGHPNLSEGGEPAVVTASTLFNPAGVVDTGTKLLVVDANRNRVLIWNSIPTLGTQPADLVLGQVSFDGASSGTGAGQLMSPNGIWSDGTKVVVADTGNHRVLIWRSFPTRNGQPADVVVGQATTGQVVDPSAPTASTLKSANWVASDGRRLVVSDWIWNRVLIWTTFPTTNGAPADIVIGQSDFTSAIAGGGVAGAEPVPSRFSFPQNVLLFDDALFVVDQTQERIVVFDPVPTATVADVSTATAVLGQPNPATVVLQQPTSGRSLQLSFYGAMAVVDDHLYVADRDRVLRFALDLQ